MARLGESTADFAARRARQEFTAAQTQALTGLIGLRPRYAADPDYSTIKRRWTDEAAKAVDEPAILISSEPVRLAYYDSLHEPLMQEARNISRQAFQGAADAHAAHREQLLQQLEQNLSTDSDDALSTAATYNLQSNIDDAVDKRFLTPEQATAEKKAAALRLTVANYGKLAQADPARAIAELTAEESPHPLVRYLPPETRDSLVARAQLNARAGQLDAERNAALAAQESQRAAARAQGDYVKLAFHGTPDLALRIANDPALTPDSQRRLLDTAQRTTQPDPPAPTSKANALQLLNRPTTRRARQTRTLLQIPGPTAGPRRSSTPERPPNRPERRDRGGTSRRSGPPMPRRRRPARRFPTPGGRTWPAATRHS